MLGLMNGWTTNLLPLLQPIAIPSNQTLCLVILKVPGDAY